MNNKLTKRANKHLSNYAGGGVDLFNFTEGNEHIFRMELTADNTGPKVVAIFPGWTKSKEELIALTGRQIDGLVTDAIAGMTLAGSPKSLQALVAFAQANPCNVVAIKMNVTNPLQFDNAIEIREGLTPFADVGTKYIRPAASKNASEPNDKLVEITGAKLQSLKFDNQTCVIVKINAETSVSMEFSFQGIYNTAAIMADAVDRADNARDYQEMN